MIISTIVILTTIVYFYSVYISYDIWVEVPPNPTGHTCVLANLSQTGV